MYGRTKVLPEVRKYTCVLPYVGSTFVLSKVLSYESTSVLSSYNINVVRTHTCNSLYVVHMLLCTFVLNHVRKYLFPYKWMKVEGTLWYFRTFEDILFSYCTLYEIKYGSTSVALANYEGSYLLYLEGIIPSHAKVSSYTYTCTTMFMYTYESTFVLSYNVRR